MAIQIPNPGTGNGQTGDNEFVLWTKVKDNFSNTTHAASRLVGTGVGNLVENQTHGIGNMGWGGRSISALAASIDVNDPPSMDNAVYLIDPHYYNDSSYADNLPVRTYGAFINLSVNASSDNKQGMQLFIQRLVNKNNPAFYYRVFDNAAPGFWVKIYTDKNTTLDGNGALKPSSPVLRVFSDRITGNDDGDAMAATYTKNGVGDYTITGTTGLRTDGWYVVIPNDMNGNPKVAIGTLDDKDGVITLKTYERIFDMSTFKFVPDLEQPLDIPEGRWIDLRFNDLLIEVQEELPTDGG